MPIRPAVDADRPELVAALVDAFSADPLYAWLYPEDVARPAQVAAMFELVVDLALLRSARVDVLPGLGSAIWTEPGQDLLDEDGEARFAALVGDQLGADRLAEVGTAMAACAAWRPREPHWCLHNIGVRTQARGGGVGRRLVDPVLAEIDRDGHPTYLESSNPRNVSFYERLGFRVLAEVPLPGGTAVMRPMLRPPAPPAG